MTSSQVPATPTTSKSLPVPTKNNPVPPLPDLNPIYRVPCGEIFLKKIPTITTPAFHPYNHLPVIPARSGKYEFLRALLAHFPDPGIEIPPGNAQPLAHELAKHLDRDRLFPIQRP